MLPLSRWVRVGTVLGDWVGGREGKGWPRRAGRQKVGQVQTEAHGRLVWVCLQDNGLGGGVGTGAWAVPAGEAPRWVGILRRKQVLFK